MAEQEQQVGPVRRSDNIGNLAWRLVGSVGYLPESGEELTPPDPTAAIPLYDALLEAGMVQTAHNLQAFVVGFATRDMFAGPRSNDPENDFRFQLGNLLQPILFDMNWACMEVVRMFNPVVPEVQQGQTEITTVRFHVGFPVRVGMTLQSPQGGRVMVITVHDDGSITGVPFEEDGDSMGYQNEGGMDGRRTFTNRRIRPPGR